LTRPALPDGWAVNCPRCHSFIAVSSDPAALKIAAKHHVCEPSAFVVLTKKLEAKTCALCIQSGGCLGVCE
jgi:hypothetical protein